MFTIDSRIGIILDPVLAQELSERILTPGAGNKIDSSIYSFGRQLKAVSIGEAPKKVVSAGDTEDSLPIFSVKMIAKIPFKATLLTSEGESQEVEVENFKIEVRLSEGFCERVAAKILSGFCENKALIALAKQLNNVVFGEEEEEKVA